jgi:O-antigen ligase
VKAVLFFFFTAFFVDTERRLRITLGLWLGLQLVRILEPLWLNLTEGYMGSSTYVGAGEFAGRLSGAPADVINPNGLGFLVVTMLPFLHYLLGASPSRLAKLLYVSIVPALVYVLVETASRGAFLTLFVAALLIFVRSRHKALLLALGLVGALVTWNAMSEFNQERYLSIFTDDTPQSATVDGRLRGMRKEFGLALDNPLFGHGVGTSAEAKHHAGYRAQAAHSLYAEVLVEIGVIGFCIFAAYLVRVRRVVRENARAFADDAETEGSSFHHRLDLALATVFWVYAVYSINYYGLSQDYWYFFGGFCVAFGNAIERRRDEPGPSPRRRPATGYRLAPDRSPLA